MIADAVDIPCHWTAIGDKLNEMRKKSVLTDVVLTCKGRTFQAHRNLLCSASQYFYSMFTSGLKESTNDKAEFQNIEPDGLELILDILYSGRMTYKDFEIVRHVVKASHLMNLEEIFIYYRDLLLTQITADNIQFVWDIAEEVQDSKILNAVFAAAEKFLCELALQSIDATKITKLLNFLANTTVPHSSLLRFLINWAAGSQEGRMEHFMKFLNFINFDTITNDEILSIFRDSTVQQADLIRNKLLEIFYSTFQIMSILEATCEDLSSIIFLGQDEHKIFQIQKLKRGMWIDPKPIPTESVQGIQEAQLVSYREEELCIATKENGCDVFLNFLNPEEFRMLRRKKLAVTGTTDTVCAAECGHLIIAFIFSIGQRYLKVMRYNKLSDTITLQEEFRTQEPVIKIQLLSNNTDVYRVIEWSNDDKPNFLTFAKALEEHFNGSPFKYGYSLFNMKSPSWFAHLVPNHIVIRFFPGKSVYFSLNWGLFSIVEDNNHLSSVAFLRTVGSTIWSVTSDGKIYIQNKNQLKSDWKLIYENHKPMLRFTDLIPLKSEPLEQKMQMLRNKASSTTQ